MSYLEPDASIPLMAGRGPASAAASNPLSTISTFSEVQNRLNQNRLFQQTFAARQKAGAIIAGSPDMDTAFSRMIQDPSVAPFAGEVMNNFRQLELTNAQLQGEYQRQSQTGLEAAMKVLPAAGVDPSNWDNYMSATLSTLSPAARSRVAPALDSLKTALLANRPDGSPVDAATYKMRMIGLMTSTGMTPELQSSIVGRSFTQNLGGRFVGVVQAPIWAGGGLSIGPGAVKTSLSPQLGTPGQIPVGGDAGGGGGGAGAPAPNPLAAPTAPVTSSPLAAPSVAVGQPSAAAGGPPAQSSIPLAGDGISLYDPTRMQAPFTGATGIGGVRVLAPEQKQIADKLSDDYAGPQLRQFQMGQQAQGSFRYMDAALDRMASGGGFLVPGTLAQARVDLAKFANTVSQMTGADPQFDPTKIASAEDVVKETKRLGLMVTNQFLGGQREAAQVIQGITASVPGIENSILGAKLVSQSLQASVQRIVDERNFFNAWQQQNQGNLTGAAEEFNRLHPAEGYAQGVLGKFGLTEKGFTSPDAVKQAMTQGFMTREEAKGILQKQFGFK